MTRPRARRLYRTALSKSGAGYHLSGLEKSLAPSGLAVNDVTQDILTMHLGLILIYVNRVIVP